MPGIFGALLDFYVCCTLPRFVGNFVNDLRHVCDVSFCNKDSRQFFMDNPFIKVSMAGSAAWDASKSSNRWNLSSYEISQINHIPVDHVPSILQAVTVTVQVHSCLDAFLQGWWNLAHYWLLLLEQRQITWPPQEIMYS